MQKPRTFLILAASFLLAAPAYATIHTVSNSPSTTLAQFNTIQAAVNASSSNDTVYVHGSPVTYATFTITNKKLAIIGPGWSPDKELPFAATVAGCTITGAGSSGTEIHGIFFSDQINVNSNKPDNLLFVRNRFLTHVNIDQSGTTYSGYVFEGNVFQIALKGASTSIYLNLVLRNNDFCNGYAQTFNNPNSTILFDHNLWYGPSGSSASECFFDCSHLSITNNIFVKRNAATNNSFSTFNNNITFNAGNNSPWLSNGNIDGGGNVSNMDPQMVAQSSVNSGINNPLLDFTIPAGPANESGSDGKDMGLLYDSAGSLNWTNSRNSRLPRIYSMHITTPTITAGGTLNVGVEARKSN